MVTLVLLPGMDGTGELFAPLLAALGPQHKVEVVCYPTIEPLEYSELESLARAALPMDGPFVLLGESFSGPIAISLAASRPPNLKGLILCCTFARNPRPWCTWVRSVIGVLPVITPPSRVLSHLLLGRFSTPALRLAYTSALAQVSAPALRTRLRSVLSVDVSAQLASLRVPTLSLRASEDRLVPAAASRVVAELKPSMQVVEIEAPHLLLQTAPSEAARVIETFLSQTTTAL